MIDERGEELCLLIGRKLFRNLEIIVKFDGRVETSATFETTGLETSSRTSLK